MTHENDTEHADRLIAELADRLIAELKAKRKKPTLADYLEYLKAPWPEDHYVDDDSLTIIDGDQKHEIDGDVTCDTAYLGQFPLHAQVKINSGVILHNQDREFSRDFAKHFAAWVKNRDTVTIVVTVEKDRAEAVRDWLKSGGIKFT